MAVGTADTQTQMIRVSEAATALNLSKVAVWAAIRRGDIPARRIGRSYLIPRLALERLLMVARDPERPGGGHGQP